MIDQANLAIVRLTEEVEAENGRRRRRRRMVEASDQVLHRLEELNLAGQRTLSEDADIEFGGALGELPAGFRLGFSQTRSVQEKLDRVFALQEWLFRGHDLDVFELGFGPESRN